MNSLDGFVLFIPQIKDRGLHLRKYPDPKTMEENTPYPVFAHFRCLLAWAKRCEAKFPEKSFAYKQVGENKYLVGWRKAK